MGGAGTVSATATSGLAVTFASTTPAVCKNSGSTVAALAAGTCTIAADQAGDLNYNPAPQVTQSITVNKAGQTIGFGATPSVVVGGTGTVSATASSGLAVTLFHDVTDLFGERIHRIGDGDLRGYLHDRGQPGGQWKLLRRPAGHAIDHREQGRADDRFRRDTLGRGGWHGNGERDGYVGTGGDLFDDVTDLFGERNHRIGDGDLRGYLHDRGQPGGQRQLQRRPAGHAILHGQQGGADDHFRCGTLGAWWVARGR